MRMIVDECSPSKDSIAIMCIGTGRGQCFGIPTHAIGQQGLDDDKIWAVCTNCFHSHLGSISRAGHTPIIGSVVLILKAVRIARAASQRPL